MPFVNRGDRFVAYYGVPSGTPSGYLNGIHWENSVDCGVFKKDGNDYILRCIHFYKDEFPDSRGVHSESFDYSIPAVDDLTVDPVVQMLIADAPVALLRDAVEASQTLHPVSKELILMDLDSGLSGALVVETRAALLDPKFLGFTFSDVLAVLPVESYTVPTGETMNSIDYETGEETTVDVYEFTIRSCTLDKVN